MIFMWCINNMNGIVIHKSQSKQICLCGVDGAGKKTFCSLFAPEIKINIRKISLKKNTTRCLLIILFDGIRQQNIAEEKLLIDVEDFIKTSPTSVGFEIWGVLTKVDTFYNKRKNPSEVRQNCSTYIHFLQKRNIKPSLFVPLAQIGYSILTHILEEPSDNNEEEYLDLRLMLGRIGIRFDNDNDFIKLKEYLVDHKYLLSDLTGVGIIKKHLLAWTGKDVSLPRRRFSTRVISISET